MLWTEFVPFRRRVVAIFVPPHAWRVVAALDGGRGLGVGVSEGGRRAGRWTQKPIQTAAAVLKPGSLLLLPKHFNSHGLEHPGVHQGLAEADGFVARYGFITEETVQGDVSQDHIHCLWAQEAVLVGLEVVAPAFDLHMSLEIGDDAAPDVGGPERLPSPHFSYNGREETQSTDFRSSGAENDFSDISLLSIVWLLSQK